VGLVGTSVVVIRVVQSDVSLPLDPDDSFFLHSDAFCLFFDAKVRSIKALNGSGRAPEELSIKRLRLRGITDRIPTTDLNSVTVPGS
jgi:gamma-glutamyltranspeptidase / glutathione hydrolase